MKILVYFCILSFLYDTATCFQHTKYKSSNHVNILPGRFIVEYKEQQQQFDFLRESTVKVGETYNSQHQNFVSLESDNENENLLQTLVEQDHVIAVYPVTLISRPTAVSHGYYNNIDQNITEAIQAHHSTQVDRLQKELGLTGKGVKICIIDSGVDYLHPALGGGFGPQYKIQDGQDLVGDDFDPSQTNNTLPEPGTPPLDNCKKSQYSNGHGTHVSGIIAGNDTAKGFVGVAPHAIINVWRVFGCDGGSSSEIIMKAMIEAEKAQCDVINMSLGNDAPWSEQPHAAFAQKLASQGISVVVSNGNDGRDGAFTVTDPAGAHDVLSVAAVSNSHFLGSLFSLERTSSNKKVGPYSYQVAPEAENDIPDGVIVLANPTTFSICESESSDTTISLKGKLALVHEGPCSITEQAQHAAASGAIGLVYFDPTINDPVRAPYFNTTIPIATISALSGHHLVSLLKENKEEIKIHFERNAFIFQSAAANTIADFSSMGPTNELDMKPSFAAIGSNVYSTLPQYLGGWGTKSGTSMSAPYIAGTIALLREAYANQTILPSVIHEKLQNYGVPLNTLADKNKLESPLRQGSGFIHAYDALKEPLHVSPAQISFNDTKSLTDEYKTHSLKVSNTGKETVTYNVNTLSSASIAPYGRNHTTTAYKLVAFSDDKFYTDQEVKVTVTPSQVTLQPGESIQVVVKVELPSTFNEQEQLMYGGYVRFQTSESKAMVHVPYFGVLGSLYNLPTLDVSTLHIKDRHQGRVYSQNDTYDFKLSDPNTAPVIGFRLATPTRRFHIELINLQEQHVGYILPTYDYAERELSSHMMEGLNPWLGKLVKDADSEPLIVQPGTYKIRWSALRMFGDLDKESDWVIQTSGPIVIVS